MAERSGGDGRRTEWADRTVRAFDKENGQALGAYQLKANPEGQREKGKGKREKGKGELS